MTDEKKQCDFWDLDKLVPPKKEKRESPAFRVSPVEYSSPGAKAAESIPLSELSKTEKTRMTDETYVPDFFPFIKRVTITRKENPFDFYDNFRKSALLYYDVKGRPCDFVPFFSYMPQYIQMTPEQKAYYFYFRDEVRSGIYPKTDYSYIYLFVYEILNLPEKIPPAEGVIRLCRLWGAYRRALPAIDKYFVIWIEDYCLLYRLPLPYEEMKEYLYAVAEKASFREFFYSFSDFSSKEGFFALLRCLSDYDYRLGKIITSENKNAFDMHMREALTPVLQAVLADKELFTKTNLIVREAFPYSLCTHRVKCRISAEYFPLSSDARVRESVTVAVKYAENCLRAVLGVRSRLSVKDVNPFFKASIDGYFAELLQKAKREREEASKPEYEKKYDAPSLGFSLSDAEKIEKMSWSTTVALVDESEKVELLETTQPTIKSEEKTEDKGCPVSGAEYRFLCEIIDGKTVNGADADEMAERINCAFSDAYGDVALENFGDGWKLIEDYREDLKTWMKNLKS